MIKPILYLFLLTIPFIPFRHHQTIPAIGRPYIASYGIMGSRTIQMRFRNLSIKTNARGTTDRYDPKSKLYIGPNERWLYHNDRYYFVEDNWFLVY